MRKCKVCKASHSAGQQLVGHVTYGGVYIEMFLKFSSNLCPACKANILLGFMQDEQWTDPHSEFNPKTQSIKHLAPEVNK
jgi:hypothetical protein